LEVLASTAGLVDLLDLDPQARPALDPTAATGLEVQAPMAGLVDLLEPQCPAEAATAVRGPEFLE
jgi:hypothetical protein